MNEYLHELSYSNLGIVINNSLQWNLKKANPYPHPILIKNYDTQELASCQYKTNIIRVYSFEVSRLKIDTINI